MSQHTKISGTLVLAMGAFLACGAAIARQESQPAAVPATVPTAPAASPAPGPMTAPVSAASAAPTSSSASPGPAPAASKPSPAPNVEERGAMLVEGEKRFATNCGRCHQSPHHSPPRMMATVVRHMRVRATITDADMRLILLYLTQ